MIVLLVCGLASARLVRLIVDDKLPFARLRDAVGTEGLLGQLVHCPWCVSAYPTLVAAVVLDLRGSLPMPPAAWFFMWWVAVAGYFVLEVLAKYATPEPKTPSEIVDWTTD